MCGKPARTDPCGGYGASRIPTATEEQPLRGSVRSSFTAVAHHERRGRTYGPRLVLAHAHQVHDHAVAAAARRTHRQRGGTQAGRGGSLEEMKRLTTPTSPTSTRSGCNVAHDKSRVVLASKLVCLRRDSTASTAFPPYRRSGPGCRRLLAKGRRTWRARLPRVGAPPIRR